MAHVGTCHANHVIHMLATWLASMRQYCFDVSDVAVYDSATATIN